MRKLVIDTDPGQDIDDLLALLFALRHPELDVLAITTATHPADRRARLVKRLLRHLGRDDIPVASGLDAPMRRMSEDEWRGLRDLSRSLNHADFAEPEDPADAPDGGDAADRIVRVVEANPGEVALACLAPLTNIAAALLRKPDLAGKIACIAMMGGETALNRVEHNVAFDPVAADIVLGSGVPVAMGTWDVTRRFTLTPGDCQRFRDSPLPLHRALGLAIDRWQPVQNWKPTPVMYDMFPLAWLVDPSLYTTAALPVRVETKGDAALGMTVVRGDGAMVAVTTDQRSDAIRRLYLDTVFGVDGSGAAW